LIRAPGGPRVRQTIDGTQEGNRKKIVFARDETGRGVAGLLLAVAAATITLVLVCALLDRSPGTARASAPVAIASISAPCGEQGDGMVLVFLPAITETETEVPLERFECGAAGHSSPYPGDDSTRRGHVVATAVDPAVLSANVADLTRLCRRLL
jgi:hypothetical protein